MYTNSSDTCWKFVVVLCAAFLLVASSAKADLRVDTVPSAVTMPERGLIILEASSLHWMVNILYEDVVEKQSIHVGYAGGLAMDDKESSALFNTSIATSSSESPEYINDRSKSLLNIANGVRTRSYTLTDQLGQKFPKPIVQYTLRINPEDARALRLLLARMNESWGQSMGVAGFNASGRAAFQVAIDNTRLLQTASSEALPWEAFGVFEVEGATTKDLGPLPGRQAKPIVASIDVPGKAHATPLGFLYAAMLTGDRPYEAARSGDAIVGTGGLESCSFPDEFSVREDQLLSGDVTAIIDAIVNNRRPGSAVAAYQILMKRAEGFDNDVSAFLRTALTKTIGISNPVGDVVTGVRLGDILFDGSEVLNQALWQNPLVVEAMALGHIDPAVIPIWRCMAMRAVRGIVEPFDTISARNVAYDEVDRLLLSNRWSALVNNKLTTLSKRHGDGGSPRFFAAAHNVTRLLGVGLVDAIEFYPNAEKLTQDIGTLLFDMECAGWTNGVPDIFPKENERKFLRRMNFDLFRNINIPVIKELNRTKVLFDPVNWGPLNASSAKDADFEFDLRMVLVEQDRIEKFLRSPELKAEYKLDQPGAFERLTNSQLALYCSRAAEFARAANAEPDAQFQIIGKLDQYLKVLQSAEVIERKDASFENYQWRVATGSAYVHLLHGKSEEEFVTYIRKLVSDTTEIVQKNGEIPDSTARELKAIALRETELIADIVEDWTEGLVTYLVASVNDGSFELFDCEATGLVQTLIKSPFVGQLLPRAQRVEALLTETDANGTLKHGGLAPILYAFELSTSGRGALSPDAVLAPGSEGAATACRDLEDKQTALEKIMTTGNPMDFLYTLDDKHFIVMERSRAMSTSMATLEPFLVKNLLEWAKSPPALEKKSRDDMKTLVSKSFDEANEYTRDRALVGRLEHAGRKRPSVLASAGITESPQQLNNLFKASTLATSPECSLNQSCVTEGTATEISERDGLINRINRINESTEKLKDVRRKICAALGSCGTDEAADEAPAATKLTPIPVIHTYPKLTPKDVIKGLHAQDNLPGGFGLTPDSGDINGALARSNFFYKSTPTGDIAESGEPIYESELIYRFPLAEGVAAATSKVPNHRSAEAATLLVDGMDGLPKFRDFPLGIVFPTTMRDPVTEAVTLADSNVQDVSLRTADFARAVEGLGTPGFVEILGISVGNAPTPENLSVLISARILGEPLGEAVVVPLIVDGKFGDPASSLRLAFSEVIEARANTFVSAAAARLGVGRLPADREKFNESAIRFGPGASEAFEVSLDWESKSLTARLEYLLEVGESDLTAMADILVANDGAIALQNITFETGDLDLVPALRSVESIDRALAAVEVVSSGLLNAQRDLEDMSQTFQIYPVVRAGNIGLSINHAFGLSFAGTRCAISLRTETGLDITEALKRVEGAVSSGIVERLGNCAAQAAVTPLAKTLSQLSETPELSLFGMTARISFGEDGGLSQAEAASLIQDNGGNLPVVVALDQTGVSCPKPIVESVRGGILAFNVEKTSATFKLGDVSEEDATVLSDAIGCQVTALLPTAIRSYIEVDGVSFQGGAVFVDATLRGMPILSDVPLRRINLRNPASGLQDIERTIVDSAVAALGTQLNDALRSALGSSVIDLAGIGTYKFTSTRLISSGSPWWVEIVGTLSVQGIDFPGTRIRIPIGGTISDLDIRMDDAETAILNQLGSVILQLLPVVPEAPKVQNLFFGKLNPQGTRYGFRFGLKAGFPLGGNSIDFELRDAELSTQGLTLGDEVTFGIPTPLYFGPVALSQVLITIVTGENKGLKIGADLTAVEPQLARVLKLRSVLDLSEIERLAFSLRSDLIALDSVNLMFAEGKLDLSRAYARFDAGVADLIKDIIDPQVSGELNGETGLVYAESKLDVVGVNLSRNALHLCSKECEEGGTPGAATLDIAQRFLLGEARGGARTDLAFRSPAVQAGVDLDLFGWQPGGASFKLNTSSAETMLSFLGMKVTIITPTYQTMDPGFVAKVLRDLLKIDLSDLLKTDLNEITISLMSPGGGVSTAKPSSSGDTGGKDGDQEEQKSEENGEAADKSAQNENKIPPKEEGDQTEDAPKDPNATHPKQETWGVSVKARVCERWVGSKNNSSVATDFNHFYYVFAFGQEDDQKPWKSWLWEPYTKNIPEWYIRPNFAGPAAARLCEKTSSEVGKWFTIKPNIVSIGAARRPALVSRCNDDGTAQLRIRPISGNSEEDRREYSGAGLPLLCLDTGSHTVRVDSRLFYDTKESEFVLVPLCPATTADRFQSVKDSREFKLLCRDKGNPIFRVSTEQTAVNFSNGVQTISAREELALYQRVFLPSILGIGEEGEELEIWTLDGTNFSLQPNEVTRGGNLVQVAFLEVTDDKDVSIVTSKLTRIRSDGKPNPLFEMYKRAKSSKAWRQIFLRIYLDYRNNGNVVPEFITENISSADTLIIHDRNQKLEHSFVLQWYWPLGEGFAHRQSLVPKKVPTIDGDLKIGEITRRLLINSQKDILKASVDTDGPLRLQLGLSTSQQLQFRLQFFDSSCSDAKKDENGGCPDEITHLPDGTNLEIMVVSRIGDRTNLDLWTDYPAANFARKCTSVGELRDGVGVALGRAATAGDLSRMFFDLDVFSQRARNFNQRPEVAILATRDC